MLDFACGLLMKKRNIFHQKVSTSIHWRYLWELVPFPCQGTSPPLLLLPPPSQLVPMTKISNKELWHSLNSPAGVQVRGDRLGRVRFLFDERVIPCLLCFLTETDSETVYHLNGCLVAVIAEGLGLVTLGVPPDLRSFFCCWEIMGFGKLSPDFLNCSSERLKPTPEFLTAFYKYSTLHEPQVLTETPVNLLCYVWLAFRFFVLCLFLVNAPE